MSIHINRILKEKYKFLKLDEKPCKACNIIFPVSARHFYPQTANTIQLHTCFKDGFDVYCKRCRAKKSTKTRKIKQARQAINFWQKVSNNKDNVYISNQFFQGLGNFEEHLANNPHKIEDITYCYFALIDKRLWNLYGHAFNMLYIFPPVSKINEAVTIPKLEQIIYFANNRDLIHSARNKILPDYPGIESIQSKFRQIRFLCRPFTRKKKCAVCRKVKQTYRNPFSLNFKPKDEITNDIYVQTLEEYVKGNKIPLHSFHFKQSYQHAARSGWESKCKECKSKNTNIKVQTFTEDPEFGDMFD